MNKTEIGYIRDRVKEVVSCTNGKISTRQEKKKKGTGLTDAAKLRQIRDGRAILLDDIDLKNQSGYRTELRNLFQYFRFATTPIQQEKIAHNDCIDSATEEMHTEVELAGKRLVDKVVLGILAKEDLPGELEELARMYEKESV